MYYIRAFIDALTWPLRALLTSPGRLFSAPRRMLSISLPARVAILVAIFLIICVVTAFIGFYSTQDRAAWNYWVNWTRITAITLLLFVIPVVVYKVLKLWMEGDVSRYPDIDYAWKAGLAELQRHGLSLTDTPCFLVVGSGGEEDERALMDGARIDFRMSETPQGPAALHWYANPDGIYLVCTDTSCLSRLAAQSRQAEAQGPVAPARAGGSPAPGGGIRGTIVADAAPQSESGPLPVAGASGPLPGGGAPTSDIRGTMVAGGAAEPGEAVPDVPKRSVTLSPGDSAECEQRLAYVCELLRRTRQPLCPINGMLTLIPYQLIRRGPREGVEVQRAVRRDLETATRVLKLRCAVTALVTGMEEERGFRELVRRVGRDRSAAQRFGHGFPLWNPPTAERLGALCAHACGSFEDWVYTLFRERDSLSKPGNTKLYALLCQVRRNVRTRLTGILSAGFGFDPEQPSEVEPMLFGGCYFAATGATDDRRAFIRGVFDKLPDQQEELEWTAAALDEDDRYQGWSNTVLGLAGLLMLSLGAMIVYRWFW